MRWIRIPEVVLEATFGWYWAADLLAEWALMFIWVSEGGSGEGDEDLRMAGHGIDELATGQTARITKLISTRRVGFGAWHSDVT